MSYERAVHGRKCTLYINVKFCQFSLLTCRCCVPHADACRCHCWKGPVCWNGSDGSQNLLESVCTVGIRLFLADTDCESIPGAAADGESALLLLLLRLTPGEAAV